MSIENKLVTLVGGGGFLGRYAARALLRAGARVRIAERDPRRAWYLKPQGGLGQVQFAAADVTRPESLARALQGSDAVVNLVGTIAGNFTAINATGAANVAAAAVAAGAGAFVHISAIGADPESSSAYGRTKGEGEAKVRAAFPDAVILRPSLAFGREDQFVNRFAQLATLPVMPIVRGVARVQPVYVGDVAGAIRAVLDRPAVAAGRTFELGGPDILTFGELYRWIAEQAGRSPAFVAVPDAVAAALARLTGWLPGAPISWDQWQMLQHDTLVAPGAAGLADLGVAGTPLAAVVPGWFEQYRRHGRFGRKASA